MIHKFLIVLIFHRYEHLSFFANYNNVYFEHEKCYKDDNGRS